MPHHSLVQGVHYRHGRRARAQAPRDKLHLPELPLVPAAASDFPLTPPSSFPRKSFPRKSFPRKSFPRKSFPRKSFPRKSFPRKSLLPPSFSPFSLHWFSELIFSCLAFFDVAGTAPQRVANELGSSQALGMVPPPSPPLNTPVVFIDKFQGRELRRGKVIGGV